MGRSYWFECPRCGYRAKVSGRPDHGVDFYVSTIVCRDCKELYDAVTRLRWPEETPRILMANPFQLHRRARQHHHQAPRTPPSFQAALNRLRLSGATRTRWLRFPLLCPVSPRHRVQNWNDPDKCPRCGIFLEKSALPYRIWD